MDSIIKGVLLVAAGIGLIIFRQQLAKAAINAQNDYFRFHFGDKEVNSSKWGVVIVGIFFIFVGIKTVFSIKLPW